MIRITRLKVIGFKNVVNQSFDFSQHNGLTLLIGNNGSGKSNVLEFISDVFKNLLGETTGFRSNFEINWEQDGHQNEVKFYNGHLTQKRDGSPQSVMNVMDYPKRVIAIYSGESERLWHDYYEPVYNTFIGSINQNQQQGGVNVNAVFPKMLYLNRFYWDVALLSLLCSDSPDVKDFITNCISVLLKILKSSSRTGTSTISLSSVLCYSSCRALMQKTTIRWRSSNRK